MVLIGLTGPARSGKDTAADRLCDKERFLRAAFADVMRDAVVAITGVSEELFNSTAKEVPLRDLGVSPRRLMQTLGTDWGRNMVTPEIWLNPVKKKWEDCKDHGLGRMVITDVRFNNEAEWIREQGGHVVHVIVNSHMPTFPIDNPGHPSENGVTFQEGDILLENPMTMTEYSQNVDHMFKYLIYDQNVDMVKSIIDDQTVEPESNYDPYPIEPWDENGNPEAICPEDEPSVLPLMATPLNEPSYLKARIKDLKNEMEFYKNTRPSCSFTELQKEIVDWADGILPNRSAYNALAKMMMEEIPELIASGGQDPLEIADVFILMMDYAHLQKVDILSAIREKMKINMDRTWAIGKNGLLTHVEKEEKS